MRRFKINMEIWIFFSRSIASDSNNVTLHVIKKYFSIFYQCIKCIYIAIAMYCITRARDLD